MPHYSVRGSTFERAGSDANVEGFNVGVNDGEVAGQTAFHNHIHLISRGRGDVANPMGGVRNVTPATGVYR